MGFLEVYVKLYLAINHKKVDATLSYLHLGILNNWFVNTNFVISIYCHNLFYTPFFYLILFFKSSFALFRSLLDFTLKLPNLYVKRILAL